MPLTWKIVYKKFLAYIAFFSLFFLFLTIFFKLSRLTKYFLSGIDLKELLLLLGVFLYRCFPFALSITSFISAYLCVSHLSKNREIFAFSTLGLCPVNLFTPMIILSVFLSLVNVSIGFILGPYIDTSLKSLLEEKKENTSLLSSFSRRFNRKDVFVHLKKDKESAQGTDFLFIRAGKELSWIVCDLVEEDKEGLIFHNAAFFHTKNEGDDFNTIGVSQDTKTVVPKSTIFSLFPGSIVRLGSTGPVKGMVYPLLIYLLHPLIFTIFGILLALFVFPILSTLFFLLVCTLFTISTLSLSVSISLLSLITLIMTPPFYLLAMHRFNRRNL
jgi:hypothetical protein